MVKCPLGASPGKATQPGGARVCFEEGAHTYQQEGPTRSRPSTQGLPSTGTEGTGDVGVNLGVQISQGASSLGPFWPPNVHHRVQGHSDPGMTTDWKLTV